MPFYELNLDGQIKPLHRDHQMTCRLTLQESQIQNRKTSKYKEKANLSFYAGFNCGSNQWKIKRLETNL